MTPALRTNRSAVATPHPQAAQAARDVLAAGGNAVDAAVASLITLCVVVPGSVGLGGYGGSMVIHLAGQHKTVAIDFDARAPLAFKDEIFASDANKASIGYLAVTAPAVIAGIDRALQQFGTMTWKQVAARALQLAEHGFPMEPETHHHLLAWQKNADATSQRALFPDGRIPDIGQTWVQKDLAQLIRRLGEEGPGAFYRGEIAETIVRQVRDNGGILTMEDFAACTAQLVEPICVSYRGHEIATPPPPSGGITALAILKTLERFDLAAMKPFDAPYFHLFCEAAKLCWADRNRYVGDPQVVDVPTARILSDAAAEERAAMLRENQTTEELRGPSGPSHTVNVSVIDADRNAVSLTATQGWQFGSRVVIEGLGLLLGHGMSRFDFVPEHPNRPAPGKRMHHNMSPTIILKDGKPFSVIGLPGGPKIITVTAQLAIDLIDFKLDAAQTVVAPRVHTDGAEPLALSAWVPAPVIAALEAMGHTVTRGQRIGGAPNEVAGNANAVVVQPDGALCAASGAGSESVAGL
jgi:gamma-glutamyltranspeptidase/glutathione hydrolase